MAESKYKGRRKMQDPFKVTSFLGEPLSPCFRTLTTKAPGCTLPTKEVDYEKMHGKVITYFIEATKHN